MFKNLAASWGFIHTFYPTATPENNGFAEGANHTILEKVRCLLIRSNLSCGWKLAATSEEGLLLGFENDNSSYWILQLQDKRVVVTRNALFIEDNFPFLDESSHTDCSRWVDTCDETNVFFDFNDSVVDDSYDSPLEGNQTVAQESTSQCVAEQHDQVIILDNPWRIRVIGPWHLTLIRGDVDQTNILPFPCRPKLLTSMGDDDALSYPKAVSGWDNSPTCFSAIEKELKMMRDLEFWDVVKFGPHYKAVGTTWVFKRKNKITAAKTEYKHNCVPRVLHKALARNTQKPFQQLVGCTL
ncbi:hypothetical protein O181_007212 [Austropuccinia psidii MF-1]|uniref:Retroviral polymerase SH3-like domain-containing protein n=1 Tax=Austropuccinia psidii MF-1 TaxID=1389203 RepID=A0A9Q3BLH3_9BASI|nr:hypothetical protein [Austropuccinia psidii MF-1]